MAKAPVNRSSEHPSESTDAQGPDKLSRLQSGSGWLMCRSSNGFRYITLDPGNRLDL